MFADEKSAPKRNYSSALRGCGLRCPSELAACVYFFLRWVRGLAAAARSSHAGLRFSRKAERPSCASVVARMSAIRRDVSEMSLSLIALWALSGMSCLISAIAFGPLEYRWPKRLPIFSSSAQKSLRIPEA